MNLLIYANLCLFFFVITFTRCVVDVSMNSAVDSFTIYIILLNYLLNLVMLCIIFSFTCFHLWLIFTGKTTIEYCEKNNKDKEFKKTNICFNRGYVNNFISVFNKNPLLWFFPFNPNTEGDGLYEGINESEENLKFQDTI